MPWCFALVNNRLAEAFFDHGKNGEPLMRGHCYVRIEEYATKKEKRWIKEDTKKFQLSYREGKYRDKQRNLYLESAPWDYEIES